MLTSKKCKKRIKSHIGIIRAESDIYVKGLLAKIMKMEDDIHACDHGEEVIPTSS